MLPPDASALGCRCRVIILFMFRDLAVLAGAIILSTAAVVAAVAATVAGATAAATAVLPAAVTAAVARAAASVTAVLPAAVAAAVAGAPASATAVLPAAVTAADFIQQFQIWEFDFINN